MDSKSQWKPSLYVNTDHRIAWKCDVSTTLVDLERQSLAIRHLLA